MSKITPIFGIVSQIALLSPVYVFIVFIIYSGIVNGSTAAFLYGASFFAAMFLRQWTIAPDPDEPMPDTPCSKRLVFADFNEGSSVFMNMFSMSYAFFISQANAVPIVGFGNNIMISTIWISCIDAIFRLLENCDGFLGSATNIVAAAVFAFVLSSLVYVIAGENALMFDSKKYNERLKKSAAARSTTSSNSSSQSTASGSSSGSISGSS